MKNLRRKLAKSNQKKLKLIRNLMMNLKVHLSLNLASVSQNHIQSKEMTPNVKRQKKVRFQLEVKNEELDISSGSMAVTDPANFGLVAKLKSNQFKIPPKMMKTIKQNSSQGN